MTVPMGWAEQVSAWTVRYGPALKGFFLRRVKESSEAEDLMQEVFLRLLQRKSAEVIERPEQYLFQTAANVLRDHLRRDAVRRRDTHVELPETIEDTGFSPERVLLGRDRLNRVLSALEDLDPKTRAVFVLYHFDGMKQAAIAEKLGVSLSTIEKGLARANKKLIEQREKVGDS